jgi:hypothetical protein
VPRELLGRGQYTKGASVEMTTGTVPLTPQRHVYRQAELGLHLIGEYISQWSSVYLIVVLFIEICLVKLQHDSTLVCSRKTTKSESCEPENTSPS